MYLFINLITSFKLQKNEETFEYKRSFLGKVFYFLVGNPIMPLIIIVMSVFMIYSIIESFKKNNRGVEFFVETEFEQAIAHVRARGNLSISEKDRLVKMVENEILGVDGVEAVFAFTGPGGFTNADGLGDAKPIDTIGGIQIELSAWDKRKPGKEIIEEINKKLKKLPGVKAQISEQII